VTVVGGAELARSLEGIVNQVTSVFIAMSWVAAIAAGLAVLTTLALSVAQRRRELGVLRAIGARRRQVRNAVVLEAGSASLLGALIGVTAGGVLHYAAIAELDNLVGFPVGYRFVVAVPLLAIGAAVTVSMLGALVPAGRVAQAGIAEALAYE
jgi:putative ABC transport system permease protein